MKLEMMKVEVSNGIGMFEYQIDDIRIPDDYFERINEREFFRALVCLIGLLTVAGYLLR